MNPGWALAGFGLAAVIVVTVLTSPPDNALGAALLFVGLLVGGFLSITVHEFGRAAAAWLLGWRVWIISVLGSPPTSARDSRWRSIIFTAGGPARVSRRDRFSSPGSRH